MLSQIIFLLTILFTFQIQYNITSSQRIFNYSYVTHCNQKAVQQWTCAICNTVPKLQQVTYITNQITKVVAYVGLNIQQNIILLAWRGTKNVQNWIQDFLFDFLDYTNCRNCKVHQGFYLDYFSVHNKIIDAVQSLIKKHDSKKIIVTGSSLGSALATVAALQLQLKFRLHTQLHTFGSPRVGNLEYSRFLTNNIDQIFRVVHNKDIIPHIPFTSLQYHHSPFQILFDEQMRNYVICDTSGQDPNCSNRFDPKYSIEDHTTYWVRSGADIC